MRQQIKNVIKNASNVPKNMVSETPKKDKKKRNLSLVIAGIGLGVRIGLTFTPAAPVALASLASEIMYIGLGGLGLAGYFQNKTIKK